MNNFDFMSYLERFRGSFWIAYHAGILEADYSFDILFNLDGFMIQEGFLND